MELSSGLPNRKGLHGLTRVIRARQTPTTITRVTQTRNELDDLVEDESEHTEDMWVFEPIEAPSNEVLGERLNGDLSALSIADGVNVERGDRIAHGGISYEIDTIVGHPTDDKTDGTESPDTDFWIIGLTRRHE